LVGVGRFERELIEVSLKLAVLTERNDGLRTSIDQAERHNTDLIAMLRKAGVL
jgi:hypothetical protein